MSHKIQIHSLRLLFNLFSRLADWSGGWWGFVRCKLLLGTLLLTLTTTPAVATDKKKHRKTAVIKREPVRQIVEPEYADISCYITANVIPVNEGTVMFDIVEQMPEFPGGEKALREFLAKNINKSLINKDKNVSEIVYCRIAISKDGTIMQTEILRSCGVEYDKDAIRVIRLMPRWNPGIQNHEKVNVYYTLAINYNQIKNEK